MVANSSEPFVVQYNLRWIVVFFQYCWVETCPGRRLAPVHQAKKCVCGACNWMREVFDLSNRFESMCIFTRSRVQLPRPKAAVIVVCPLTALIDAHIKELQDHANLANKNYCRSIHRKENSEILHSRKLIGLFKAIWIFLTSMEEVILLGLLGTTESSLTWSSGFNTFSFCLNKDLGGTLGRELNATVDFFLAGLLEVGELTKTNRSNKKPVWRAVLFQNRMEVRFVTAVTKPFFSRSSRSRLHLSIFTANNRKKKRNPLAPRV